MSKKSNLNIRYAEMMEDLEASFIAVTNNINVNLKSKAELIKALQLSGRNPSQRNVDRYWRSFERIGINEFIEIGKEETELNEDDLISIFREIDIDNNGFISYRELVDVLTQTGESMGKREAQELIQSADLNRDNKIDYREFSKLIMNTIRDTKNDAKKHMKKLESNPRIYSPDLRRHSSRQQGSPIDRRSSSDHSHNHHHHHHHHHQGRQHHEDLRDDEYNNDRKQQQQRQRQRHISGSRLSFADEKEFLDSDYSDEHSRRHNRHHPNHHRSHSRDEHLSRREASDSRRHSPTTTRSSESLRSLMKSAAGLSNSSLREDHRDSERRNSKLNNESTNKSKKFHSSYKLYEIKLEASTKANSRATQEPKNLKKWPTKAAKGGVYLNDEANGIFSNSYVLDLKTPSNVHFSIHTTATQLHSNPDLVNMDVGLVVVKNGKNLAMKTITENKINNKFTSTINLEAGTYFLFPFTTGCHLKKRNVDFGKNSEKLFKNDLNGKKTLTNKFKNALNLVFDMFDLDTNGRLNRNEMNFYSIISSNEEIGDEDWEMLEKLVELKKGEITKEAFLRLYEIEAESENFSVDDMYRRLFNLGFNKALEIDQSCPFEITVSCEHDKFEILLGEIFDLKNCARFIGQLVQEKGTKKKLKELNMVEFYEYHNSSWSVLRVDNVSSREGVELKIVATKSDNCVSNSSNMEEIVEIKPNKSKIALFLAPNNPNKEWTIRYEVFS